MTCPAPPFQVSHEPLGHMGLGFPLQGPNPLLGLGQAAATAGADMYGLMHASGLG